MFGLVIISCMPCTLFGLVVSNIKGSNFEACLSFMLAGSKVLPGRISILIATRVCVGKKAKFFFHISQFFGIFFIQTNYGSCNRIQISEYLESP